METSRPALTTATTHLSRSSGTIGPFVTVVDRTAPFPLVLGGAVETRRRLLMSDSLGSDQVAEVPRHSVHRRCPHSRLFLIQDGPSKRLHPAYNEVYIAGLDIGDDGCRACP